MKTFVFERDVVFGQSKGCAVVVQVGFSRLLWMPGWARNRDCAALTVHIAAPVHNPEIGYQRRDWSVRCAR